MLYFSDAVTLVMFLAGSAWILEKIATRNLAQLCINITPREMTKFLYMQLGIVLLALVGFKFVVLSGGPGDAVHTILKTGSFTRGFSALASAFAVVVIIIGAWRWVQFTKQKVVLKWFK